MTTSCRTLYCVSWGAQENKIKHYCFTKCGQIVFGVINIDGGYFGYCYRENCPHCEEELDLGRVELSNGEIAHIIVRKLKSAP